MWNVDVKKMCRKHLLGEHLEMHMFIGVIRNGKSLSGYISKGLVEIENISKRHNALAEELIRRGYNHKSEIENTNDLFGGKVDVKKNEIELKTRCKECFKGDEK